MFPIKFLFLFWHYDTLHEEFPELKVEVGILFEAWLAFETFHKTRVSPQLLHFPFKIHLSFVSVFTNKTASISFIAFKYLIFTSSRK